MNRRAFLAFAAAAAPIATTTSPPAAHIDTWRRAEMADRVREVYQVASAVDPETMAVNYQGLADVEEWRDVLDELTVRGECSVEYHAGGPLYIDETHAVY